MNTVHGFVPLSPAKCSLPSMFTSQKMELPQQIYCFVVGIAIFHITPTSTLISVSSSDAY